MPKSPLKYKVLRKKLKLYGVVEVIKRGKGSERILFRPESEGSMRGPSIPIKCHGEGKEISIPVIDAILRRFGIDKDEFWE